jgi:Leucine-rich repeat (LRR) protein
VSTAQLLLAAARAARVHGVPVVCDGCTSLRKLPEVSNTDIGMLSFSGCSLVTEIPDLPPYLDYLHASDLPRVRRLPALSSRVSNAIYIDNSGITELPDPLPAIRDLNCSNTRIQQLPVMAGCRDLDLQDCKRLQQLPGPLPAGLNVLNCTGCTVLQQLPAQLPDSLQVLHLSNCTQLQRLPDQVPEQLLYLHCEGCSSLQELPDFAGSRLQELRIQGCTSQSKVCAGSSSKLVVHLS